MIHLYTGDGKGKTTAALGLAIRAAGQGKRIAVVQFLKGSETGELASLQRIPHIKVFRNREDRGFFHAIPWELRLKITQENNDNLRAALAEPWDVLVLDEVCAAYKLEALDREAVDTLLRSPPGERELVLTGRDPPGHFYAAADYVSEIRKIKHPFEKGLPARKGIEY